MGRRPLGSSLDPGFLECCQLCVELFRDPLDGGERHRPGSVQGERVERARAGARQGRARRRAAGRDQRAGRGVADIEPHACAANPDSGPTPCLEASETALSGGRANRALSASEPAGLRRICKTGHERRAGPRPGARPLPRRWKVARRSARSRSRDASPAAGGAGAATTSPRDATRRRRRTGPPSPRAHQQPSRPTPPPRAAL